ncbi:MAG: hypothetical protein WBL62_00205 [Gallionella sp.]
MPSPAWHCEVLNMREQLVVQGLALFRDWEDAKDKICASVQSKQK